AAKGITFASAQRVNSTSFSMEGVEPARVKDVRVLLKDWFREWEVREQGEGKFLVEMPEVMVKDLRQKTVEQAAHIIRPTAPLVVQQVVGDAAVVRRAVLERTGGKIPETMEIVQGQG